MGVRRWLAGSGKRRRTWEPRRQKKELDRWRDQYGTLKDQVCVNKGGDYLRVEVSPTMTKGKAIKICFPTGIEGHGWSKAAASIETFVGLVTVRIADTRDAERYSQ